MTEFRNNGAIGAILDEYEKAILELQEVINQVTNKELIVIVDHDTKDSNCRSIQTILAHVVKAGYGYVIEIRRSKGEPIDFKDFITFNSIVEYQSELDKMFEYNEKLFADYPGLKLEERNPENKISVKWGQQYDAEQLFEHAIVHILRHRRQIERFLLVLRQNENA